MYIYYRQCHRTLKPAAVFPIEVELGINLERYHSYSDADTEAEETEVSGSIENGQSSLENNSSTTEHDEVQSLEEQGQSPPSQQLPPVEDLLLDFGEPDSTPPLALQNSGLEQ